MRKELITFGLVAALGIATLSTAFADMPTTKNFRDLAGYDWAKTTIEKLTSTGALSGYPDGTYRPGNNITIAEFVKVATSCVASPPKIENYYQNSSTHWAAKYMDYAEAVGMLEGLNLPESTWDNKITRQQMAVIMENTAVETLGESKLTDSTKISNVQKKFYDFKDCNESYKDEIVQAYARGLIAGYPDKTFGPNKNANRAEAATMIIRLVDKSMRLEADMSAPKYAETFTLQGNGGYKLTLPQREATLEQLGIEKIEIYKEKGIKVFTKTPKDFNVLVNDTFATQSIQANQDYWVEEGMYMYYFTAKINPKGQLLRVQMNGFYYVVEGAL